MTTNMELASQVGKGDGAPAAGEVWVSRRPESAVMVLAKKFLLFFSTVPPDFQNQNGKRVAANQCYFSRNFKNVEKLLVG